MKFDRRFLLVLILAASLLTPSAAWCQSDAQPLQIVPAAQHLREFDSFENAESQLFAESQPIVMAVNRQTQASVDWAYRPAGGQVMLLDSDRDKSGVWIWQAESSVQLSDGALIWLSDRATLEAGLTAGESGGLNWIEGWTPEGIAHWRFRPSRWGNYSVKLVYSLTGEAKANVAVDLQPVAEADRNAKSQANVSLAPTEGVSTFRVAEAGRFRIEDVLYKKPHQLLIRDAELPAAADLRIRAIVLVPAPEGQQPVQQTPGQPIVVESKDATVIGTRLVYEPNPKKLTLGFWTKAEDRARWELVVERGGTFDIEVTQGCGKGQGGSRVAIELLKPHVSSLAPRPDHASEQPVAQLEFSVKDTGHFQNFETRQVGQLTFTKGRYLLQVRPLEKKKNAVMDLQRIRFTRSTR